MPAALSRRDLVADQALPEQCLATADIGPGQHRTRFDVIRRCGGGSEFGQRHIRQCGSRIAPTAANESARDDRQPGAKHIGTYRQAESTHGAMIATLANRDAALPIDTRSSRPVYNSAMPVSARLLAFAGLIPFVAATALLLCGVQSLPLLGPVDRLLSSYTLLIVSFMAGTHWGMAIARAKAAHIPLYLPSNLVALTAWFTYLLAPLAAQLVIDAGALLVLLVIEHRIAAAVAMDDDYVHLRTQVSTVAVAAVLTASVLV